MNRKKEIKTERKKGHKSLLQPEYFSFLVHSNDDDNDLILKIKIKEF